MKRSGNPIKMPEFARNRSVLRSSASILLLLTGTVAGCVDEDELTDSVLPLEEVEPSGPAVVDHLGLNWIADESSHGLLVIDDDGQIVDRYELDGLVGGVEDIEVTETHVYVLTVGGAEPVIARAGRKDVAPSAWETFPIPAHNLDRREVTGLRKNADGIISVELEFGREYLPLFTADGNLDITAAPLAGPGSTHVIFDVSGYLPANSDYVPLGPTRLLDTRLNGQQYVGPLISPQTIELILAGHAGLPQANAIGAVVLNVTVVPGPVAGFLTVYPDAQPPNTSNINFSPSENTAGLVIIAPGPDGRINVRHLLNPNQVPNAASHLVVDVFGYFPPSADIHMVQPERVFDSREVQFGPKLPANSARDVQLAGVGGIPFQGVGAVIANVTAANSVANGSATVYEDGAPQPINTRNLHYFTNVPRANLVIIPVSNNGFASIYTTQSANYIVDVLGWFGEGVDFEPIPPQRIVKLDGLEDDSVTLFGFPDIPNNAVAIFGNLTADQPTAPGFLQVYFKNSVPIASTLNFNAGKTVSNAVLSGVGNWGNIRVRATILP